MKSNVAKSKRVFCQKGCGVKRCRDNPFPQSAFKNNCCKYTCYPYAFLCLFCGFLFKHFNIVIVKYNYLMNVVPNI